MVRIFLIIFYSVINYSLSWGSEGIIANTGKFKAPRSIETMTPYLWQLITVWQKLGNEDRNKLLNESPLYQKLSSEEKAKYRHLLDSVSLREIVKNKDDWNPFVELGGGVMHAAFPDYPGSAYTHRVTIPYPAAIVRGGVLRLKKDEGVRGIFKKRPNYEIDLSFDGSLPASRSKNIDRRGLPRLRPVFEIGPSLIWKLGNWGNEKRIRLNFHNAIRYGFATDIVEWEDLGLQFNPFLSLSFFSILKQKDYLNFTYGAKWSTRKLHGYYYDVAAENTTADRLSYQARSGLMEQSLSWIYHYPITRDWWLFQGGVWSDYRNASNREAPLFKKDSTFSLVFGVYFLFYKSELVVRGDD